MYQNRHPSSSHNQMKVPAIPDYLDRLRDEFNMLQQQVQNTRMEAEKKNQEVDNLQRHMMSYYEMMMAMNVEVTKQVEIAKRFNGILQHVIPLLPVEHQPSAIQAMEQARNITPQEVMNIAQSQQQPQMRMMSNMGALGAAGMMGPAGFNPFLAGLKPEDLSAMFAMNPKGGLQFMSPMGNQMAAMAAAAAASTSQGHPMLGQNHSTNNNTPNTASASTTHPTDTLNSSRAASATSRPHSGTGTPTVAKRPKTEMDETDGELEIDVQNDDAASSSAQPSSHTNGTSNSHKKSAALKDGRESAQSVSSRDSTSTPKSSKQSLNAQHASAVAAAAAAAQLPTFNDMNALFGQLGAAGNMNRFLDPARMMFGAPLPTNNGVPPYAFKITDRGNPEPVQFPADAFEGPGIPKNLTRVADLQHGEVVCAVTIAPVNQRVYTGGKGCVKVWDVSRPKETTTRALHSLECLNDNYIRSCKLLPDNSTLLVGGESKDVCIVDLNIGRVTTTLDCEAQACYALVVSADGRHCFSCCADGNIVIWDLVSHQKVGSLKGHDDGASCVDLSADGKTLWTGGLDNAVCTWDVAERKRLNKYEFDTQVFSLGCSPADSWVAVGMENAKVEMLNPNTNEKYALHEHENCVLSLRFAHSGKWFVSTGKDSNLFTWRSPYGARLVKIKETTSVLSCDISIDDKYIVTGSGEKKASLYEVSC